ncbi:MAG: hypothetical protein O2914_06500 [Bacteroidetes bacterium]|jgi:hypothetical protein|nr:hypothetical protein [Bacteroidota bacterium]MDA0938463.1 hypothetical protein [Bacteroidota bacterium]MDA1345189.1 hypothetical protein [Bacteroidota bacterium]
MKTFIISEILYWVIALISLYKTITLWGNDSERAYLFLGFCALSIFMALFRRHYRKKFNQRSAKD